MGGEEAERTRRGIREMLGAVLEDAARCARGAATGTVVRRAELHGEAWAWIEGAPAPFTFVEVCEVLGVSPSALRRELLVRRVPSLEAVQIATPETANYQRRRTIDLAWVEEELRRDRTLSSIAAELQMSISKLSILTGSMASRIKGERDGRIRAARAAGATYPELARQFGLSRLRILSICTGDRGKHRGTHTLGRLYARPRAVAG